MYDAAHGKKTNRGKGTAAVGLSVVCLTLLFFAMLTVSRMEPYPDPQPAEHQIAYNRTERRRKPSDIQYIVVHDTANTARGADAMHHYTFFNRANQGSSADFFVDDGGALKVNDYYAYYTWHCGDGQGRNGISNENSVGVEICVNRDGNYRRAVKNAAELVRSLMTELGIDASHVVRHYDASGKECPRTMMDDDWSAWKNFQDALASAD